MPKDADGYDFITQILRDARWKAELDHKIQAGTLRGTPDRCWPWLGRRRGAYGAIAVHGRWVEATHRLAWAMAHGRSPFPLHVLHRCDNPVCVNPAHLFLGTPRDNSDDKIAKGRARTAPQRGERNPRHRLTAGQVEEIRERMRAGPDTNMAIAADYGVSHATISLIRRGRTWGGAPVHPSYESLRSSPYSR